MKNNERYNIIHTEVMKRLGDGEITTEQAKELNNRFFDKYITESFLDKFKKTKQIKTPISTELKDTTSPKREDKLVKGNQFIKSIANNTNKKYNEIYNKYKNINIGNTTFDKITDTRCELMKADLAGGKVIYVLYTYNIPQKKQT